MSDENLCTICLDPLNNEEPVSIIKSCNHIFHKNCLNLNMASEGTDDDTQHRCPLCRKEFDETNVYDYRLNNDETVKKAKPTIPDDVIRDYIDDLQEVFDVDCEKDLEDLKQQYGDRYEIDDAMLKSNCIKILKEKEQAGGKRKSNKIKKAGKTFKKRLTKKENNRFDKLNAINVKDMTPNEKYEFYSLLGKKYLGKATRKTKKYTRSQRKFYKIQGELAIKKANNLKTRYKLM
jgi:hypothetical protein